MITDKDIAKLKQVFSTKDDLKEMEDRQDKKYASKDDLIKFKDEILGEIVKLREDSTMDTGTRDTVEDHETRLEKVEKHLNLT